MFPERSGERGYQKTRKLKAEYSVEFHKINFGIPIKLIVYSQADASTTAIETGINLLNFRHWLSPCFQMLHSQD